MNIQQQLSRNRRIYEKLVTVGAESGQKFSDIPTGTADWLRAEPEGKLAFPSRLTPPSSGSVEVDRLKTPADSEGTVYSMGRIATGGVEGAEASARLQGVGTADEGLSRLAVTTPEIRFPISDVAAEQQTAGDPVEQLLHRLERDARSSSQLAGEEESF